MADIFQYRTLIFHVNFALSGFIYLWFMVTVTTDQHHTLKYIYNVDLPWGGQNFSAQLSGGGKNIVRGCQGGDFPICTDPPPSVNNDRSLMPIASYLIYTIDSVISIFTLRLNNKWYSHSFNIQYAYIGITKGEYFPLTFGYFCRRTRVLFHRYSR